MSVTSENRCVHWPTPGGTRHGSETPRRRAWGGRSGPAAEGVSFSVWVAALGPGVHAVLCRMSLSQTVPWGVQRDVKKEGPHSDDP